MQFGTLADHFDGVGAKYLAEVEINLRISNQHEFQGVNAFRKILGETDGQIRFPTTYYWMEDDAEYEPLRIEASCTWNDVRRNDPNRGAEYRLYYPAGTESIVHRAYAGDLLIIARTREARLLVILCPGNSTTAQQMLWLFGLNPVGARPEVRDIAPGDSVHLGYAARTLLDALDIQVLEPEPDAFGLLIDRYGTNLPNTKDFSKFARETLADTDCVAAPDDALAAWMDHEEALFRHIERYILKVRLAEGFGAGGDIDIDGFTRFAVSIVNRRKSRAGWALGHHLEALLDANGIRFTREARTENSKRPDFLFPGEAEYANQSYNAALLTMLGAKRTCKDRWRQVLSEANRIPNKHLLTIEPSISVPQTDEMKAADLQLVIPRSLFGSYQPVQQGWLMDVEGFINLVKSRQQS